MLKGKKALFILLPLTIVIWGLIGYKIYTGLKGDDVDSDETSGFAPIEAINNKTIDTFSLFNNYHDPFLTGSGKLIAERSFSSNNTVNTSVKNNNSQAKKTVTLPPINNEWPSVKYSGIIKNESNSISLLLLSLNGKTYSLKQGDEAEGLKVISFTNNEVVLLRGKEKRTFTK